MLIINPFLWTANTHNDIKKTFNEFYKNVRNFNTLLSGLRNVTT